MKTKRERENSLSSEKESHKNMRSFGATDIGHAAMVALSKKDDDDFVLRHRNVIYEIASDFTPYAEVVIKRTYARGEESWGDIVLRVIETIFFFRKQQIRAAASLRRSVASSTTDALVLGLRPVEPDLSSSSPKGGPTHVVDEAREQRELVESEEGEQELAFEMAVSMAKVQWLPPGRGLQMCRKDYIERFGSFALNNCGFTTTGYFDPATNGKYEKGRAPYTYSNPASNAYLLDAVDWFMKVTMLGVGVGYNTYFNGVFNAPAEGAPDVFVVQDTRESWAEATVRLLSAYLVPGTREVTFDYSRVRPKGALIRSFGGYASGPEPLRLCHHILRAICRCRLRVQNGENAALSIRKMMLERLPHDIAYLEFEEPSLVPKKMRWFADNIERLTKLYEQGMLSDGLKGETSSMKTYGTTRTVADIFNCLAMLVESGNMRRVASLIAGSVDDDEFLKLKDWSVNGERDFMHTSNNSVQIWYEEEYDRVAATVGPLVESNGEPGILNMCAIRTPDERGVVDTAMGANPCTEANLGDKELCCLVEVFVNRCRDAAEHYAACRHAAIYAAVVSCIPTKDERSDAIIRKNHRIGASHTGIFEFHERTPREEYITRMRTAGRIISDVCNEYVGRVTGNRIAPTAPPDARRVSPDAPPPACIRTRAIKPSGTIAPLGRASPGIHPFIQSRYVIRRMRIAKIDPLCKRLIDLGVPHEIDLCNVTSMVFEFVLDQGECRTADGVSMWELWDIAQEIQDDYADMSVSLSLYFKNHETKEIRPFLRRKLPYIKVVSFMPLREDTVYPQQPYQSISREEYERRAAAMPVLDLSGIRAELELVSGCDGAACQLLRSG